MYGTKRTKDFVNRLSLVLTAQPIAFVCFLTIMLLPIKDHPNMCNSNKILVKVEAYAMLKFMDITKS